MPSRLRRSAEPLRASSDNPYDVSREDSFTKFVYWANGNFSSFGHGAKLTQEQKEIFDFLDYKITAEEFRAAEIAAMLAGFVVTIVSIVALALLLGGMSGPLFLIGALLCFMFPLIGFMLVAYHPQQEVKREQTLALGYVPEIVNYLASSMRLIPNMEKAVEFASVHGRGKIAEDLKRVVWDVQIGKYLSVEEAVDALAYKWGKYNDDFKQALMMIRSSVLESDDTKREVILEKAVENVLEGSREKMDVYARALSQPTVYLYYFGVLLPLMLAIVLPIGGALVGDFPLSRPEILAFIYLVGLPIGIYILGSSILGNRPPTYIPPEIPEDYPGLPGKNTIVLYGIKLPMLPLAVITLLGCLVAGYFLDQTLVVAGISEFEKTEVLKALPHVELLGIPPEQMFFGIISISGLVIGIALSIAIYLYGKYSARKKVQDDIREMEKEFKDAIYVLASRLGENKPMEEALGHAVAFLPNSKIAQRIFQKILDNITTLGMTIDDAIFDPKYGALKNIPSRTIESGMQVTVSSIGLGVNVAAKSLIGLALQLRNAEKIDLLLRNLLSGVTSMLKTMGTFIAPIVLGVVTSLQGVIVNAMTSSCGSSSGADVAASSSTSAAAGGFSGLGGGSNLSNLFCKGGGSTNTNPALFTLIMGIYVIEVVILLTYFNSQVEDSNNKLHTYVEISKALPLAAVIFALVAYYAGTTIGG